MNSRFTVIVTGGNSGIGYSCVRALHSKYPNLHIIVASRTAAKMEVPAVETHTLDLSTLASVRAFVTWLQQTSASRPPLRYLICCAGATYVHEPRLTSEGFEVTFATNHLGHFLLSQLVIPLISDHGRVVIVASGTHDPAQKTGMPAPQWPVHTENLSKIDWEAVKTDGHVKFGQRMYSTSKLLNVMTTYSLAKATQTRWGDKVTVVAYDPGMVPGTNLGQDYPAILRGIVSVLQYAIPLLNLFLFAQTPKQAGDNLAILAVDERFASATGKYFAGTHEIKSSELSYDQAKAEDLYTMSAKLAGLSGPSLL
jgi:NAD(P)-dependent dehydrogenase (short-subunit alcohol dehydrogenase family)